MKIEIRKTKSPEIIQITTIDERWYHRESDGKIVPSSSWISSYYPKGEEFTRWVAANGWDEANRIKETRGRLGGRVHNAIAAAIHNKIDGNRFALAINDSYPDGDGEYKEFNVEEWEVICSFKRWWDEVKPKPSVEEQVCWNDEHLYAGTLDFKCVIDDQLWLIDFKTSASIYPNHRIQLSSYLHTPQGVADRMAILQLGYKKNKAGWKFTEIDDEFELFLAVKKIFHRETDHITPKQKDYPSKITLD